MFTYVLGLIKSHTSFLVSKIQPLLDENKLFKSNAKEEFIKIILNAIKHKFKKNMNKLLLNSSIFYHTLNETIAFESNLRNIYNIDVVEEVNKGPNNSASLSCIDVFTESSPFNAWLELEYTCM